MGLFGAAEQKRQIDQLIGWLEVGDDRIGDDPQINRTKLQALKDFLVIAKLSVGEKLNHDPPVRSCLKLFLECTGGDGVGIGGAVCSQPCQFQFVVGRIGAACHGDTCQYS